jgi:hypothetical protein
MPAASPVSTLFDALAGQIGLFLALLLCVSALHKLLWRTRAQRAVAELSGLGWRGAGLGLIAATTAEIAAAGWMLAQSTAQGALLAAVIWSGYFALIARALFAGRREIDCGCSFGATHRPLGAFQLWRAATLAALAVLLALPGLAGENGVQAPALVLLGGGGAVDALSRVLGAIALLSLYAALDRVMALGALRGGLLR